jgi:hypothetical protein
MSKDFVDCSIDQDLMQHGEEVASVLRAGKGGGIPWFVFLDPSQPIFIQDTETGALRRRESAILATADGPKGNVGCPMAVDERTHFLACLASARKSLSDEELLRIAELQLDFAKARDEKYGQSVAGIPAPPTSFKELEGAFKKEMSEFRKKLMEQRKKGKSVPLPPKYGTQESYFPQFRSLAKNYLAPPNDRGQALLWCFSNFRSSGVEWKNPGAIQTGLADSLILNWSDAEWADGLAAAIARNKNSDGFNAEEALSRMEGASNSTRAQANAAYHRANLYRRGDEGKFESALTHFIQEFPSDARVSRAEGYLRNLRLLKLGKEAPNFSGTDVDGNPISLSDYRGKVTFLVFWGFW